MKIKKMIAEAELVCRPQGVGVLPTLDLDVLSSPRPTQQPQLEVNLSNQPVSVPDADHLSPLLSFVPTIRSGSFADQGPRISMEDEHVMIDDLSLQLGSPFTCPKPSAFYGVFDGHGGPDAAAFVKNNVTKFFFEAVDFPQASEVDKMFLEEVEDCLKRAFLLADDKLCEISSTSGTTALTALILGRLLMVANAGDCRAVLCRKGEAIEMSQDHRPICPSEKRRVEEMGGYIDDGYLNGELSVTRALGDWVMKNNSDAASSTSPSPLIAEPELRQIILTEDDEFLIIGCDGIWDVMSSQQAVSQVRRGLRRHDDPERCAKDLVLEALRLNTFDNLTVIIVCFTRQQQQQPRARRMRCSLSAEALCNLRKLLEQ